MARQGCAARAVLAHDKRQQILDSNPPRSRKCPSIYSSPSRRAGVGPAGCARPLVRALRAGQRMGSPPDPEIPVPAPRGMVYHPARPLHPRLAVEGNARESAPWRSPIVDRRAPAACPAPDAPSLVRNGAAVRDVLPLVNNCDVCTQFNARAGAGFRPERDFTNRRRDGVLWSPPAACPAACAGPG